VHAPTAHTIINLSALRIIHSSLTREDSPAFGEDADTRRRHQNDTELATNERRVDTISAQIGNA
jgi:hypothetical protein